ncbi:MAG: glycosyltransferase family 2 protein [Candidatus Pacearchaeota archaeon]|nr:glycosyltransferase family 2 protein [Candidatus Pacearchaeota archaeon]
MISIVIPIKNEAKNLDCLVKTISMLKLGAYQIIFIDDNSLDGTLECLKSLSKKYPIKYVIRKNQTGYGSALKLGLEKVRKSEIVVTTDGDLSYDLKKIPELIKRINKKGEENDIVIGSRYVPGGKIKNWPFSRILISKLLKLFVSLTLNTNVKDNTSGCRAYSKKAINKILPEIKSNGYSILEEILFIAKKKGLKVVEIPITFQDRTKGKSKAKILKEGAGLIKTVAALRKRSIIRFLKFLIVGASGIIVNEGLLYILTEKGHLHYLLSGIISIEISILSNFFLNDAWTFRDKRDGYFFNRLMKFNFARALTLIINLGISWSFTLFGLNYLIANLIGIAVATLLAYSLSNSWVWYHKKQKNTKTN